MVSKTGRSSWWWIDIRILPGSGPDESEVQSALPVIDAEIGKNEVDDVTGMPFCLFFD